ncbi:MAG TPA: anaerobic glycerol-3-phosphate dehydrogenase subunit C [Candidatus Dormibacteraeota bacterium]|jgi:glycerol-3-phosphate dehydrogenase subunit C|nr:anaerobic glycerol-3-phosphate dehydrogenase subunit C [Candidatus Dormibacteraeota bacterium]
MSEMLFDEVARSADRCIKCNVCNTACPVMPATDLFPGPKYCGPQAQRHRPGDPIEEWVDYCSGCGACTRACPSGVKVAELNARARASVYRRRGIPLRNRLLGRSELLGRLGSVTAPVANLGLESGLGRRLAERLIGIHHLAPVPRFSQGSFRRRFRRLPRPARPWTEVAYFHGCATNYYEPWLGEGAVALLRRLGVAVELPPQHCCGLPLISNGEFDAARRYAQRNIRLLLPAVRAGRRIVTTSTSCGYTLKAEYREVLGIDTPEAREVAAATYDIFELLREAMWEGRIEAPRAALPRRVLYHPPCQLRSHGIGVPAADFLGSLEGIELEESGVECCGIAGTYGLKREKYAIARRVGEAVVDRAGEHRADVVACDSETCRWQIQHLTGLPSRHPLELVLEAMGEER